jgi:hypothetical protein
MKFSTHGLLMNPTAEELRRGVSSEEAIRERDRPGGKTRPSRGREPSQARRATIDQLCYRLACDFDETVLAIESILRVRSKMM